jgi:hypothetical protein
MKLMACPELDIARQMERAHGARTAERQARANAARGAPESPASAFWLRVAGYLRAYQTEIEEEAA